VTSKRGQAGKRKAGAGRKAPDGPLHIHFDNVTRLGEVFEVTPARIAAALRRHPALRGRVRTTISQDGDTMEQALRTADILFAWRFDRSNMAARAPKLRWVHAHGAGVNHLMPLDWLPPGAVLTNSRGVHGPKADQYTLMALLMLNNRIPETVTNQRKALWKGEFGTSIEGKTVLIVGVGHVGGGAAKWAKQLGMRVLGIRRTGKPHPHVDRMYRPQALQRLLPTVDFVLVTAPHTEDTHHLLGRREIDLLRPGTGLVNYSRAHLVDYEALRSRLERGELTAILDVFDPEPLPSSSPLWTTPNLIITPHCSSDDRELYTPKTIDLVFRNVPRFIKGQPLINRVDPKLQY